MTCNEEVATTSLVTRIEFDLYIVRHGEQTSSPPRVNKGGAVGTEVVAYLAVANLGSTHSLNHASVEVGAPAGHGGHGGSHHDGHDAIGATPELPLVIKACGLGCIDLGKGLRLLA